MASSALPSWKERQGTLAYVLPFVIFLAFLGVSSQHWLPASSEAPIWFIVMAVVCWFCWPSELPIRPRYAAASVAIGILVFLIWIAPDQLIPNYRSHPLFSNSIMGRVHSSLPAEELGNHSVLFWRTARAVIIVPIVEELFWRAWLMRWLIDSNFRKVALGSYSVISFWLTAILFASEHGPYWDVGLITGAIYNAWMIRTKSTADCILMHAVTNCALSLYVVATSQWQYWQ